jgi:hypothetical protein
MFKLDRRTAIGAFIAAFTNGLFPSVFPPESLHLPGEVYDPNPIKLRRFWIKPISRPGTPELDPRPVDYDLGGAKWEFNLPTSWKTYHLEGYKVLDLEGHLIRETKSGALSMTFTPLDGETFTIVLNPDTIETMKWIDSLLAGLDGFKV